MYYRIQDKITKESVMTFDSELEAKVWFEEKGMDYDQFEIVLAEF